jgi:hypothetical protein
MSAIRKPGNGFNEVQEDGGDVRDVRVQGTVRKNPRPCTRVYNSAKLLV